MGRNGLDVALICTDAFASLAAAQAQALGWGELPLLVIPHPLGGLKPEEARARATIIADRLAEAMGGATTGA